MPADLSGGTRALHLDCIRCEKISHPVDATHSAVSYAFPWSGLIAQYKFSAQTGRAAWFAALMLQHPGIALCLAGLTPQDWVVPLPLALQRLQTRGFDQSWLLAQHLASQSGTRAQPNASLLLRIRETPAQSTLPLDERLINVAGAFAVDPLKATHLAGRHVVLVDDVMTSGASIHAAALALRAAHAARVTVLVLARTEA
jgi:ComF family protein